MSKRRTDNPIRMSIVVPDTLKERLIRRAAVESADSGKQVSLSAIVQDAIEEYLDSYEGATYVPAAADTGKATPTQESPQTPPSA
jgi:hypothetical protein